MTVFSSGYYENLGYVFGPIFHQGDIITIPDGTMVTTALPAAIFDPTRFFSKALIQVERQTGCLLNLGRTDIMPSLAECKFLVTDAVPDLPPDTSAPNPAEGAMPWSITAYQMNPDSLILGQKVTFKTARNDLLGSNAKYIWPTKIGMLDLTAFGKYTIPEDPEDLVTRQIQAGDIIQIVEGMPINILQDGAWRGKYATKENVGEYCVEGAETIKLPDEAFVRKPTAQRFFASRLLGEVSGPNLIFLTHSFDYTRFNPIAIHPGDVIFVDQK